MFSIYPSPDQHLLIEALLLPDDEAKRAARGWLDRIVFDDLDLGTRRLVPLLHKRMLALGIDHPLEGRIRGIYRRAWYVERNYRHMLAMLLGRLAEAGIPVVLLKGPSLGLTVYPDPALRPYDDIDLLVSESRKDEAQALLTREGFATSSKAPHAVTFGKPDHPDVDLHISPFHHEIRPDRIAPLWERRRPLDVAGEAVSVLGAEDQLRHILAHGLHRNELSPVRWIVDAAYQLRASRDRFDWDLFTREAIRLDMVEDSINGLRYIRRFDESIVDARALAALEARSSRVSLARWYFEREYGGPIGMWFRTRHHERGLARIPFFFRQYAMNWGVSEPLPFIRHAISRAIYRTFAR